MDSLYSLQKRFSVLARLDRKYFNLANRIRLARFLVRAGVKQNLKYLMGINLNELKSQRPKQPDEDARAYFQELTEEAQSGPIFTEEALMAVQQAGDSLPKEKAKALANLISKDENPDLSSLDLVIQWLMVNDPSSDSMTYTQVEEAAHSASEDALEAPAPAVDPNDPRTSEETKKLIVYSFADGYFITQVPVGAPRLHEGTLMDNCIKSTWKDAKEVTILSLRDPHNKPHVSISLTNPGNEILEIRGKQNKVPVPKYMKYVTEFMQTGIVKENIVYWALFNKEKFKTELVDKVYSMFRSTENDEAAFFEAKEELDSKNKEGLLSLAINQTPFVEFLDTLSYLYPVSVITNPKLDKKKRDTYVTHMLENAEAMSEEDNEENLTSLFRATEDIPEVQDSIKRVYPTLLDHLDSDILTRLADSPIASSEKETDDILLRALSAAKYPIAFQGTPKEVKSLARIAERNPEQFKDYLDLIPNYIFFHIPLPSSSKLRDTYIEEQLLEHKEAPDSLGYAIKELSQYPDAKEAFLRVLKKIKDSLSIPVLSLIANSSDVDKEAKEVIQDIGPSVLPQDAEGNIDTENASKVVPFYSFLPEGPNKKRWEDTLLSDRGFSLKLLGGRRIHALTEYTFLPGALGFLHKLYTRYPDKRGGSMRYLFGEVPDPQEAGLRAILGYFNPKATPGQKKSFAKSLLVYRQDSYTPELVENPNLRFIALENPKILEAAVTKVLKSPRENLEVTASTMLLTLEPILPADYFRDLEELYDKVRKHEQEDSQALEEFIQKRN